MADTLNAMIGLRIRDRLTIAEMYKRIADTANVRAGERVSLVYCLGNGEKIVVESIGKEARVNGVKVECKNPRDGVNTVPGVQLNSDTSLDRLGRTCHKVTCQI